MQEPQKETPAVAAPDNLSTEKGKKDPGSSVDVARAVLGSASEIKEAADALVLSGERTRTVLVRSHLRRSMGVRASAVLGFRQHQQRQRRDRQPKQNHARDAEGQNVVESSSIVPPPGVDYVCLGVGEVLSLRMTVGRPDPLLWSLLCERTRKDFVDASGLILPTVYVDGRPVPSTNADDLDAVEIFAGLQHRWMPLVEKAIRAIGSERSLASLYETVKTDVRSWVARNHAIAQWAAQEPLSAPTLATFPVRGGAAPTYKHPRFTRGHYAVQNTGRHFVSIDMRAASHAVLLVEGLISEPTWRDVVLAAVSAPKSASSALLGSADLVEYIVGLKKLRASALAVGSGHGRQMALMACAMADLFARLVAAGVVVESDLAHFARDELVLHVDGFADAAAKIAAIRKAMDGDRWAPHLVYSAYRMEEVGADAIGYVLVHDDGRWELKCVDGAHAAPYARLWHDRVARAPALGVPDDVMLPV
nr:hypothetical protein [Pandoravirus massiliensis]